MNRTQFIGGSTLRIHVNINNIRHNAKSGDTLPVCRVQSGMGHSYGDEVIIKGPSRLVYRPNDPLACGAKVWVETEADVDLLNVREYNEPLCG